MKLLPPLPHQLSGYHRRYVESLPKGIDILALLAAQVDEVEDLFAGRAQAGGFRPVPEAWSLAEVLAHLVDTEQIMATRMRRIVRGDGGPQAGFDQDAYVAASGAEALGIPALLAEFWALREAFMLQVAHVPQGAWMRQGMANGMPVVARTYPFLVAAHVAHHLERVKSHYLPALAASEGLVGKDLP